MYHDLIILGAGPAGLTAGIYAVRRALKTLIISKDIGGQTATTLVIENYPGFSRISGPELMDKCKKQYEQFGGEIKIGEVIRIEKDKNVNISENKLDKKASLSYNKIFSIETGNGEKYQAKTIVLALGVFPQELNVPGEQEFKNKGVSYCVTCDGPLYKNKVVAVVGGGNSAMWAVEFLAKIGKQVYLIHRRHELRAEKFLVDKVKALPRVEWLLNTVVKEIAGSQIVEKILVADKAGQIREIAVNGVFVEIGHKPKTDFLRGLVDLNEHGEVKVDREGQTSEQGVFAAGDATDVSGKQIVIAAGEGAKAALAAYRYLQG